MEDLKIRMMALASMVSGLLIIALSVAVIAGIPYWMIKAFFLNVDVG